MGLYSAPIGKTRAPIQDVWNAAPLDELIIHIVSTHHSFLRSRLPGAELIFDRILENNDEIGTFILALGRLFVSLRTGIEAGLAKEENILFPYLFRLAIAVETGTPLPRAPFGSIQAVIRAMEEEHDNSRRTLQEVRRLTNGYSTRGCTCAYRIELFRTLQEIEADLEEHIALENDILFRKALQLEPGSPIN